MSPMQLLIIGRGWSGEYIAELASQLKWTFASTTTNGRNGTIPFVFDPASSDLSPFKALPEAETIVITFPLVQASGTLAFLNGYAQTHPNTQSKTILLGSTRPWTVPLESKKPWISVQDPIDPQADPARSSAEDALLQKGGSVLNLSGLWGGTRQPSNWISRIASSQDALASRTSVHLVHGIDVARAVIALAKDFTPGQRWIITDERVYDWWDLIGAWGNEDQKKWVSNLMDLNSVNALPRSPLELGRCLSSREFWKRFGISPLVCRVDQEPSAKI